VSKVDDLRALREARYAQTRPRGAVVKVGNTAAETKVAKVKAVAKALSSEALCGHRAISGKTCIRPEGHSEKNHRYAKAERRA
jgi:hypothetical protein